MTALVDHKFFGQLGDGVTMDIPEAVVGIVSGGVRNEERNMNWRKSGRKSSFSFPWAVAPAMEGCPPKPTCGKTTRSLRRFFATVLPLTPAPNPEDPNVPKWTPTCAAVDEVVKVDIAIPGCPPHPDWIVEAISALLAGKTSWSLPERSVCDTCPVIREQKSGGGPVKRWLQNMEFNPEEGLEKMRCINEQGFLCMGPVTLAGCAGKTGVPRCIQARTPCRGCFGPIRKGARPMVEMMGALTSVGLDPKSLVDRRAMMNRYIGGHGFLTVLPPRPAR